MELILKKRKYFVRKYVIIVLIMFIIASSILGSYFYNTYAADGDTRRTERELAERYKNETGKDLEFDTIGNGYDVTIDPDTGQRIRTKIEDPYYKLSKDEKLLSDYSQIRSMIKDMCNTNDNLSEDDIFNSDAMINKMFSAMTSAISSFNNTPLYSALTGLGILILMLNFSFSFYQNMPNIERKTTEQIMRMLFQFIISCFIIANVGRLLNTAIGTSQFLLDKATLLKNGAGNSTSLSIEDEITLLLLKEAGLDKLGILDKVLGAIKAMGLTIKLFLPWIICIFSKLGILFSICKIAIETVVYAMFYPLAAGDCYENIKHSNFMKYTKHIFACLAQLAIIVLILYAANIMLSNVINDIVNKLGTTKKADTVFEILVLLTVIQLSKTVVVMSSTSVIAHKAFGE